MARGAGNYYVDASGVLARIQRDKQKFIDDANASMHLAMNEGTNTAKALAPVDTGKLKLSITSDVKEGKARVIGTITANVLNSSGKDYARYQEDGWTDKSGRYHEGKKFMLAGRTRAETILNDFVRKGLSE